MKKTFLLFANNLRRSRGITFAAILGGIALCLIFNTMISIITSYDSVPVGLLAQEETPVSEDLRQYLTQELGMTITEGESREELSNTLVERRIAAIIEIPEGYQAALLDGEPKAILVSFLDDYANGMFIRSYLESYTSSLTTLSLGAQGQPAELATLLEETRKNSPTIETSRMEMSSLLEEKQQDAFQQVIGFYMVFSFLLGFGVSFQIFDDRKGGVYGRVKVSSVRSIQYVLSLCLVGLLNSLLLLGIFFIYLLVTGSVIGIALFIPLLLALLFSMFVVGLSLLLALYLNSRNAIVAGIIGISTIMSLLGGAYFPINTAPEFMQKLARLTPHYWMADAIRRLQVDPTASWWLNALILALFALICFVLAGVRFVSSQGKKPG